MWTLALHSIIINSRIPSSICYLSLSVRLAHRDPQVSQSFSPSCFHIFPYSDCAPQLTTSLSLPTIFFSAFFPWSFCCIWLNVSPEVNQSPAFPDPEGKYQLPEKMEHSGTSRFRHNVQLQSHPQKCFNLLSSILHPSDQNILLPAPYPILSLLAGILTSTQKLSWVNSPNSDTQYCLVSETMYLFCPRPIANPTCPRFFLPVPTLL